MLINLRNALMAGKRLPYDAEVEYLESTGTQWIDTGLTFDVSSVVDIALGITPTATTGRDGFFYGLENLSSGNIGLELYRTDFYFAAGTSEQNLGAATIGARYDFLAHYESGNSWIKTNGTTTATLTNAFTNISSRPMYLFSRYVSPATNTSKAKIYSFKVYKNNVLVRDFIPVRKGTVGYLYDRVSGKLFGNAGTGDFVVGQDVVPVEYIESHGTEYVNIGPIVGASSVDVTLSASEIPSSGCFKAFGVGYQSNFIDDAGINSTGWCGVSTKPVTVDTFVTIRYDSSRRYVDNASIGGNMSFFVDDIANGNSLFLFCGTNGTVAYITPSGNYMAWRGKIKSCIVDGNPKLREIVSIRVGTGSTWEGAMMDVLTRKVYRNAGTGAFGYGNDLKYPIPAS